MTSRSTRLATLFVLLLALTLLIGESLYGQPKVLDVEQRQRIERLISGLGDETYSKRESATEALIKFGDPATEVLTQALKSTSDPEVPFRLQRILAVINAEHSPPPKRLIHTFLTAVIAGNHDITKQCLTDKARIEMDLAGVVVEPPGSPHAKFTVGQFTPAPDGRSATVASTWADKNDQQEEVEHLIVWHVRLQSNGAWKVAGMQTKVHPELPLLHMDFENPEQMTKRVEEFDNELRKLMDE